MNVTMMRYSWLLVVLVVLLAACGGGEEEAAVIDTSVGEGELSLPDAVDVDTVAEIRERDDVALIDMREQWEYDDGHIPGVARIPLADISRQVGELPADTTVIVICGMGLRSAQVADNLRREGFDKVHNMQGGMNAWENAGYPVER